MFSPLTALALAFCCLHSALLVKAGLYVIQPLEGSTCRGGQPCTVTWVDDGQRPLISSLGVSTIGLYTGKQKLVQSIEPVDVTTVHSVIFTPNPAAGPNSDDYYISITSTKVKVNDSIPYSSFSPYFRLTDMFGSFDSPLPSATSSISIPASLTRTSSVPSSTSTITVGVSTTSRPPAATVTFPSTSSSIAPTPSPSPSTSATSSSSSSTSSRLVTSISPSSSESTPSSTSAPSNSSGAVGLTSSLPSSLSMLLLALVSSALMLL